MTMQSKSLAGKTIFITGGSLGIGYVTAEKCAEAGAKVIIASRTEHDLKKAVDQLKKKTSQDHFYYVLDVGDRTSVQKCAEQVRQKFGDLDGLINCAGIYGPIGPLNEIDIQEFETAVKINFLGTVYMCHYFAPLLKNRNGKIINFSGGGAATPFPNYSAYATTKTAIVRLTENLAEEFQPLGIKVNAIAPGFVVTRLHDQTIKAGDKAGKNFLENTKKQVADGGVPPEKAAELSVFLLSQNSDGINGKFISAPWDDWKNDAFIAELKKRKNFTTLRRIDNKSYFEKE